jgi:CheY-like chemotaxis protein
VRDLNKKGGRILVIQQTLAIGGHGFLDSTMQSGGVTEQDNRAEGATVLLVEDTEDNRQMMRKLLEISGYQVVEAINGREAVEVAARVHPQIILMDLSLPFIDGLAATRRIRSLPGMSKVPIIAVSAHDSADFHHEALEAGCDAYITKPIDYAQVEDTVKRLLARKS